MKVIDTMEKQQVVWDSLLAFIDTYEVVYYSTNGVCSLVFLTCIAMLSKKFGVPEGRIQVNFSKFELISVCLLVLSMLFCIVVFFCNFYLQSHLADYFYSITRQKNVGIIDCNVWDKWDESSVERLTSCFKDTHNSNIKNLVYCSIISMVVASFLLLIWFFLQVIKNYRSYISEKRTTS